MRRVVTVITVEFMKTILLTIAAAACGSLLLAPTSQAHEPAGVGFWPAAFDPTDGFYSPYGLRYSTSVRTPPHFALNPPVYYGSRYARPYGLSPFAAPPQFGARAASRAIPLARTATAALGQPLRNPYCPPAVVPAGPEGSRNGDLQPENGQVEELPLPAAAAPGPSAQRLVTTARRGPIRLNPWVRDAS